MFTARQDLVERIQELPEGSQKHVFQILRRKGIKYTENANGVFFNLTQCEDAEIWEWLQRIVDQQTTMQRENQERENRIREMQEVLRAGDRASQTATSSDPEGTEAPVAKVTTRTGKGGKSSAKARDILSMLAK
jgi:hypothetical protein